MRDNLDKNLICEIVSVASFMKHSYEYVLNMKLMQFIAIKEYMEEMHREGIARGAQADW